jgi:hypothetical protein
MRTMAISKWEEKYDRAKAALANLRERTTGGMVMARYTGEAAVVAGIAGGIRGAVEASGKKYAIPSPGGDIPPELPASALLLLLAMSKPKGKTAKDFHAGGTGVLSYLTGRSAENFMRKRGSLTPGEVQ